MHRLLLIVALLLTLANVVSPALAASIAVGQIAQITVLVDSASCLAPSVEQHRKTTFKPCSKKTNGKSVPCQSTPMIFSVASGPEFPAVRHAWDIRDRYLALNETFAGQFRPPRPSVVVCRSSSSSFSTFRHGPRQRARVRCALPRHGPNRRQPDAAFSRTGRRFEAVVTLRD